VKTRVAITGAGGFLGTALAQRLLASGMEVHALGRNRPALAGVTWHVYDLAGPVPAIVTDADVIVHAAFAMGASRPELERLNISAAEKLREAARRHQRHFVFISSMSAHAEAVSSYGRAKWRIEQALDPARDAIVRPGLIIGAGGVYARMLDTLCRAPVVPVFYGGTQPVQPVALDDLVTGLQRIIDGRVAGAFNLGLAEPITIRELYRRMLAAAGRRRMLVPLPGGLAATLLRGGEALGLRLPLTSENLLGQKHLRAFASADSLARLGLTLTPLADLPWTIRPSHP
jgi:nucleoside-diphosphate-sugar epimerase